MFQRITPTVRNLLIINVAIFLVMSYLNVDLISPKGKIMLSFYGYKSEFFRPYQLFTYMFLHGGTFHLLGNMFALFIFGPMLEKFWGPKRFLLFYLVTGIGAGLIYSGVNYFETNQIEKKAEFYLDNPSPGGFASFVKKHGTIPYIKYVDFIDTYADDSDNAALIETSKEYVRIEYLRNVNVPMLGASGAVFGILMAFGLLFPNTVLMLLFPPIPIKAKYFVLFYGLFELYSVIKASPTDNVAHFAHLGGMLFAFILIKIWQKNRKKFY